jgi:hypothetical protein
MMFCMKFSRRETIKGPAFLLQKPDRSQVMLCGNESVNDLDNRT